MGKSLSSSVYFINTIGKEKRNRMLKTKKELNELKDDDTNIYKSNIFDYYSNRSAKYENICLADFVSEYKDDIIYNI